MTALEAYGSDPGPNSRPRSVLGLTARAATIRSRGIRPSFPTTMMRVTGSGVGTVSNPELSTAFKCSSTLNQNLF